jgi:hypothetical protein
VPSRRLVVRAMKSAMPQPRAATIPSRTVNKGGAPRAARCGRPEPVQEGPLLDRPCRRRRGGGKPEGVAPLVCPLGDGGAVGLEQVGSRSWPADSRPTRYKLKCGISGTRAGGDLVGRRATDCALALIGGHVLEHERRHMLKLPCARERAMHSSGGPSRADGPFR